VRVDASNFAVQ
jgi:ferritin-like metal-binding protein YciE